MTFARRCWGLLDTGRADLETGDSLVVRADPNRLQSLFGNLFRNAVEHGSTGYRVGSDDPDGRDDATPTVRVGAIDREGFYVEDDGPGIPESERERVFEAGYTTASAGTGFAWPSPRRSWRPKAGRSRWRRAGTAAPASR
ncbi:MAG: HAMP domain-containing sensor histidine kinase [Haloarculaceae archaeon]